MGTYATRIRASRRVDTLDNAYADLAQYYVKAV